MIFEISTFKVAKISSKILDTKKKVSFLEVYNCSAGLTMLNKIRRATLSSVSFLPKLLLEDYCYSKVN